MFFIVEKKDKAGPGIVVNQQKFFLAFGKRVRELRRRQGLSQEDMIAFGFSARHWYQIETGRTTCCVSVRDTTCRTERLWIVRQIDRRGGGIA
jgi:hypothetical protein